MTRSDYKDRQERKKERLLERADRAEQDAKAAYEAADRIAKSIPLGQPILIGTHSEKGHRADIKRIDRGMRKSIDKSKEADELQRRAEAVGTGGISSDDPEAVQKLQSKIEKLERQQELMKAVNAAWRTAGKPAPDASAEVWKGVGEAAGIEPGDLDQLRLDMARRWAWQPGAPFPSYSLSNLSAELRRVQKRIEALRQASARPPTEVDHGICKVVENVDENRIQLVFDDKPPEATRALLKQWGFRWSPIASAWQRHLNDAGRIAARIVLEKLGGGQS